MEIEGRNRNVFRTGYTCGLAQVPVCLDADLSYPKIDAYFKGCSVVKMYFTWVGFGTSINSWDPISKTN